MINRKQKSTYIGYVYVLVFICVYNIYTYCMIKLLFILKNTFLSLIGS